MKTRTTRDKDFLNVNVLTAARQRIETLYDGFDKVTLLFSGGKDSTACLHLLLDEARKRDRLPLRVVFYDEEAIHPPTIEYVRRVMLREDVALEWLCLPFRHRNACSNEKPWWQCWHPDEKHLWVREMPEWALTTHPRWKDGMTMPEFSLVNFGHNEVGVMGIRTQESLRRLRLVTMKKNDNYLVRKGGFSYAYPIYDWSARDVWKLVRENDYDYNRTYDFFNRTRMFNNFLAQRVGPPYGEEPIRGLWKYAECWPELWHKLLYRVPGVATAWRYANTDLYLTHEKPEEMTWREYTELLVDNYTEPELRDIVAGKIERLKTFHAANSTRPIHETEPDPTSGCSWKFLAKVAMKGDLKDRTAGSMVNNAIIANARNEKNKAR